MTYFSSTEGLVAGFFSCIGLGTAFVIGRLGRGIDRYLYLLCFTLGNFVAHVGVASSLNVPRLSLFGPGIFGGMVSGAASLCSFLALDEIGLAMASALWCGVSTVVSFMWGKGIFAEPTGNIWLSMLGLLILVIGIVGVCLLHEEATPPKQEEEVAPEQEMNDSDSDEAVEQAEQVPLTDREEEAASQTEVGSFGPLGGIMLGIVCGILGGSSIAPLHYAPEGDRYLTQLFSFGLGHALSCVCIAAGRMSMKKAIPQIPPPTSLAVGVLSGLCWGLGNVSTVMASDSSLGLGIAQPLRECHVIVCLAGGFLFFGEMRDHALLAKFSAATAVTLTGIFVLAYFGDPKLGK